MDSASGLVLGPTSAAFKPDPADNGVSVYRHAELESLGRSAEDVANAGRTRAVVATVLDSHVTDLDLRVLPDPMGEPQSIGPAHALISGWEGLSSKESRRRQRALAEGCTCSHPPGPWAALAPPG